MVATSGGTAGDLLERLEARRDEIEQTLLTRVYAVSDPAEVGDPEYALGLRTAVTAALRYALECLGTSEAQRPSLPPELPAQARSAARAGVSLDTVLRRYFAGYTLLTDCLVRAAQQGPADLAETMRSQAELFDRLIAAVTEAYAEESERRCTSTEQRRTEKVKRMLKGELLDTSDLGYPMEGWHLGIVALGEEARGALRVLAADLDLRPLIVAGDGGITWAWLGAARRPNCTSIARHAAAVLPDSMTLCLGEPARGLVGWRLTHHQAASTLTVARRRPPGVTRYQEVSLLTSMLQDEVLLSSLQDLYLAPLAAARGGAALRETLGAYFAADRNIASAASSLGVARQTVASRLRTIEDHLGRPLAGCAVELEMALALAELRDNEMPNPPSDSCHIAEVHATAGQETH